MQIRRANYPFVIICLKYQLSFVQQITFNDKLELLHASLYKLSHRVSFTKLTYLQIEIEIVIGCVPLGLINDPGSWRIRGIDESTLEKDLSFALTHHDPFILGRLILIQIIPKKRTRNVYELWNVYLEQPAPDRCAAQSNGYRLYPCASILGN